MEQSSNLFIIIITVMQVLSRVASDCPVNETLHILRDDPLLEKYRSVCDYLRNVTFPTLDETSFNKSQAYCVKEFERHHSDLTNFIKISCSHYFIGITYPEFELSKTSILSSSTALAIDETDSNTTKSTTIIHNLTTSNMSDVSASTKEYLLSTSITVFADNLTTVSTTVKNNFTTGYESDISDSTKRSLLNTSITPFADNGTTVSTTVVNNFTTDNERDISDSTERPILNTSTTLFADNRTTVSTKLVNNSTTSSESDISDSTKKSLLSTSTTEFAEKSTRISATLVINFTTSNESDISDSPKKPLLSTSTTEFADKSTTVSTTVVNNFTTGNESDIGDSKKKPLMITPMTEFADNRTTESTELTLLRASTLADEDLTTDKSDESDGKKVLLTTTRPSTYVNFSELNSTIIRSETSTTTVMTTLGKKIETTTAKVVKPRTRTKQKITPNEAGISTMYALLLFFTAVTLGIIVIVTVLIVYKKFRTGSYEPEAGLRDTSLELEDSL